MTASISATSSNRAPSRARVPRLLLAALCAAFPAELALAQVTNAPVAPDTIYVARRGAQAGLSVIDLNGFGASTGDPTHDPTGQTFAEGWSMYPFNPNVRLQGALMQPPLAPGTSTLDGGSAGVFTLTRNSSLENLLLRAPAILSVSDMMLGLPLDLVYNNGPAPRGCQAGGGNLCAFAALQVVSVVFGAGLQTLEPYMGQLGGPLNHVTNLGNPISWAPHPNPPPLGAAPLCQVPYVGGIEPTGVDTPLTNLLVPGDALGQPLLGIPPSGLLVSEQNSFFVGPHAPAGTIAGCEPYALRQQLGHFLYIADRTAGQIVVVNSNTFRVLARIAVPDCTELAMSPDLKTLAVTQQAHDQVSFVDTDPGSTSFHQVVHVTSVGDQPIGIAWQPDDEDILVCNQGSNSVSILHAQSLALRKTVRRGLDRPFAIALSARQANFGTTRLVYYAWILDRSGHVTLFESGPNTVNGWGYDDIIGRTPFVFPRAKALQPDPLLTNTGVWVVHEVRLDANGNPTSQLGGALSKLVVESSTTGPLLLTFPDLLSPNLRGQSMRIETSIGDDQLSGVPLDIAFDDQRNLGALAAADVPINGKHPVRQVQGQAHNTNEATYIFVPVRGATPGQERVDVLRLATGQRVDTSAFHPGIQSISAPGAALVMDYFRQ